MRKTIEESPAMETTQPIHVKYRPLRLEDVIGQDATVKSLKAAFKAKARPHVFLFTGPAGTGKTTLARIALRECGCPADTLVEVDAASNSGIDDMRGVTAALRYNGFGASPNKGIIIDECHGLSKQAWDSLLKSIEEPPPHVFFAFCSTLPGKIPAAIVTRCLAYSLNPVKRDDLFDLLEDVCAGEDYRTPNAILNLIVQACEGSPRQALTMLAKVHDAGVEEAEVLLELPDNNPEIIDLCRMLVKGDLSWSKAVATLKAVEAPAESIRIVIVNYLNACVMGARSDGDVKRLLDMLHCFTKPCNTSDKLAPLLLAFGDFIFD